MIYKLESESLISKKLLRMFISYFASFLFLRLKRFTNFYQRSFCFRNIDIMSFELYNRSLLDEYRLYNNNNL